jgi:YHS domain-containing protein
VNPKYAVVFEGKVIGFCCPNCPKEFWADPKAFAEKLK